MRSLGYTEGAFDYSSFKELVHKIKKREEIKAIFDQYKNSAINMITDKELIRFYKEEQGIQINSNEAKRLIQVYSSYRYCEFQNIQDLCEIEIQGNNYEDIDRNADFYMLRRNQNKIIQETVSIDRAQGLSLMGFGNLLFSKFNRVFDQDKYELNHDMEQPLSNYFISSSHNTFLDYDDDEERSKFALLFVFIFDSKIKYWYV